MASNSPDLEILVHITAPSRATDDVAYRQLAQAYLAFQPQTRTIIPSSSAEQNVEQAVQRETEAPVEDSQPSEPLSSSQVFATPAPETLFPLDSQDLSFESAIDNRFSPKFPVAMGNVAEEATALLSSQASQAQFQDSWCAPASEISDSYPLPEASMIHVSPSRVLRQYLSRSSSSRKSPTSPSASRGQRNTRAKANLHPQSVDVPSSIPIPTSQPDTTEKVDHAVRVQVIPVTPVVPKRLVRKRQNEANDLVDLDISHISSTDPIQQLAASSFRSESEPPPLKRPKTDGEEPEALVLVRSSSDTGPVWLPSTPGIQEDFSNTLEIMPPPPPTGIGKIDPSSFVSDKLAKLERDISSRYQPEVKRAVDPLERGYWLVDCTAWGPETMRIAWNFLANYFRKGYAGWGVWCHRGPAHDWLRLYCWGHITKHTYLLLYLASDRHLKPTGAKWHGADGTVVLEVAPNRSRLDTASLH